MFGHLVRSDAASLPDELQHVAGQCAGPTAAGTRLHCYLPFAKKISFLESELGNLRCYDLRRGKIISCANRRTETRSHRLQRGAFRHKGWCQRNSEMARRTRLILSGYAIRLVITGASKLEPERSQEW